MTLGSMRLLKELPDQFAVLDARENTLDRLALGSQILPRLGLAAVEGGNDALADRAQPRPDPPLLIDGEAGLRLREDQRVLNHLPELLGDDRARLADELVSIEVVAESDELILDGLEELVGKDRPAVDLPDDAVDDHRLADVPRQEHGAVGRNRRLAQRFVAGGERHRCRSAGGHRR